MPSILRRLVRRIIHNATNQYRSVYRTVCPKAFKLDLELNYWNIRASKCDLSNDHYSDAYTKHVGLESFFYEGTRILDIGCGPLGSLEWAEMALERIGLDPLASTYIQKFGARQHKMVYVKGCSETIPFPDKRFDVVSSFNSLDHTSHLDKSILEIARVVKPGGSLLLIANVNYNTTVDRPQALSWDIVTRFIPYFDIMHEKHYEKTTGPDGRIDTLYDCLKKAVQYDHSGTGRRIGILVARFQRKNAQ